LNLASLNSSEKQELLALLDEKEHRIAGRKLWTYYPDEGPLRRELYAKHLKFFEAGKIHRERACMAGNRVGKTEGIGGFEVSLHLTGLYDDFPWWPGYRYAGATNWLCGGDTSTTTRDILVRKLLGPPEARGTGLIPRDHIRKIAPYTGIPGHVDYALIESKSGGESVLQFRSYDQGREAWQGTERDGVWFDEEPPQDIYVEGLMRTATTKGLIIATFTPLRGMTDVALSFMPELAPT
jgi:phage terminase large subunit-like protein